MVIVGSVVKFNSGTSVDIKLGEVVEVIEKGYSYKVDDLNNTVERVLQDNIIAAYHKEQRVW